MKKRYRLTRRQDFQRLLGQRRIFAGRSMVAFGSARQDGIQRIGVAASRRLPGAVARNRARRRLREAAQARLLTSDVEQDSPMREEGIGYDVVLIAREGALSLPMALLKSEASAVRSRLRRSLRGEEGVVPPRSPEAGGS